MRTLPACAAVSAVFLSLLATGPASAASGPSGTTVLSLSGYSSIVADSVHHEVFVSGTGSDPVAVTDFTGKAVTTLTALDGATSLALSADSRLLYAAISGTDQIVVVSTATLQEVAVYFTGTGIDPRHLAVVGNDLWFSYANGTTGELGVLDPATLSINVTPDRTFYGAPILASSPEAPGTLVAGAAGQSPSVVASFNVSSGSPVEIAQSDPWAQSDGCENLTQLAVASSTDVITACGWPYHASSLTLAGMTQDATYQTGPYDTSVAVAGTGQIAVGLDATSSSVNLFTPGDSTATSTFTLSGFGTYGLAWNSTGTTLFAVTTPSPSSGSPTLNVINVS